MKLLFRNAFNRNLVFYSNLCVIAIGDLSGCDQILVTPLSDE
ncbi:hypothetical protein APA_4431 [Pseudanabaena sp. lw0831]|nr:hypothetical protein APA_4431 [Pseudanabaena sp. lw0831]